MFKNISLKEKARYNQLIEEKLCSSQLLFLMLLEKNNKLNLFNLSKIIKMTYSNVYVQMNRMTELKLVKKEINSKSLRVVDYMLTQKGEKLLSYIYGNIKKVK